MRVSFLSIAAALVVQLTWADPGTFRWASTGGGWRAMVSDMGFANLFHQAGVIGNPEFSAYSGASGATWFGTQFFYSQNFYTKTVNGTPDELSEFVTEWMTTYLDFTEAVGFGDGIEDPNPIPEFTSVFDYIRIIADLNQILKLLKTTRSWAGFVTEMLAEASSKSYQDPGFANRAANSNNRIPALQAVDFIAQTTLAQQARNRSLDLQVNLGPTSSGSNQAYSVVLPAIYSVSSSQDSGKGEFTIGGFGVDEMKPLTAYQGFDRFKKFQFSNYEDYYLYPAKDGKLLTNNNLGSSRNLAKGRKGPKSSKSPKSSKNPKSNKGSKGGNNDFEIAFPPGKLREFFGGNPSTAQIASISSAAVGALSPLIPATYAQMTSFIRETEISNSYFGRLLREAFDFAVEELFNPTPLGFDYNPLDGLAVCSQFPNPCGEDDGHFIDGAYTDNPALVMNIAQYQKAGGSSERTLKIVLTNTNEGKFVPSPQILAYFSTETNANVPPGEFIWGEYVAQMSQQIFKENMTAAQLLSLEKPAFGSGSISTVELRGLQTVDNLMYGVQAGFTVDLLIINTNADISTFIVGSEQIKFYTPRLSDLAKDIASSPTLLSRVQTFFSS